MKVFRKMNDVFYIFKKEFYTVFRDYGVITFFILLCLFYPVVYAYIYSNEIVREVPVAVVDHANTPFSREFIRNWEAAPAVKIAARCGDMEEARHLMYKKEIYGIMEIPADFSKEFIRGEQSHAVLYCDMGALLNYKALLQAASDVSLLESKKIQVMSLPYASKITQQIAASPVKVEEVKMYNPQSGFTSFIIPAVLVLVIQQSLLLGVGMLAGTARDKSSRHMMIPLNRHYRRAWSIVVGKGILYLFIYFVMAYWVFLIVPRIFGMTQIAFKIDLMLFLFPFLLACVFFAIVASFISKEREYPFLLFVFTSVPLMFISGISWPKEGIADYWLFLAKIFPSTHAIDGFVKLNNMGASLTDVLPEYMFLWILAGIYFVLACCLYALEIRKLSNVNINVNCKL